MRRPTPADLEREALATLRAELRPLGIRVRTERGNYGRVWRFTAGATVLHRTGDQIAALSFGAGLVAGHRLAA